MGHGAWGLGHAAGDHYSAAQQLLPLPLLTLQRCWFDKFVAPQLEKLPLKVARDVTGCAAKPLASNLDLNSDLQLPKAKVLT